MHALKTLPALLLAATLSAHAQDAAPAKPPAWSVNAPPGAAKTASIDVTRGTWMSVDISPDGKTLVFDLLGDLYTLPITGGEAKALTHSIAWEQQARFSPDGKRIAYLSDAGGGDNLWVMNADGSEPHAVTQEDFRMLNNPAWHPSGKYLLARKHYTGTRSAGSGEIWLYAVDADAAKNKGVQLNEKPNWQKDLGEPAISNDGKTLYYSQDTTPGRNFEYNKDGNGGIYTIFRQDLSDGSVEPFVQGPGGAVRPTPSPDGKYLAFIRRVRNQSTLFLKDLATGVERPAWSGLSRDLQEIWAMWGVYPSFAWMPGSKEIVIWAEGRIWRVDPFKGTAAEIPFHVKDTRELREPLRVAQEVAPAKFAVHQLRGAQVSPDGKRVVYSALGSLYLKDLPHGTPRRLTQQTEAFEFAPSWARDGSSLVYVTWRDDTQGSVRRIDLASGKETTLVKEPGKYLEPRLSPDGKQLVYRKVRGGGLTSPWYSLDTGLYLVAADGCGKPERISKEGSGAQFGARSDELFFTKTSSPSEVDQRFSLIRLNLRDRAETEVARSDFASEYSVSPDGQWLGFVERYHAYVTPLPNVQGQSGKAITVGAKMDALPVRQLDVNAGSALHWSGDSQQLHFTLGDELFTASAAGKGQASSQKIGFEQASDAPSGKLALIGARVVTMKGDEVIEGGSILIDGNRIVAVGRDVAIPADARRIDASGKTIVPGFIDAHWHGSMSDSGLIPQQSWVNLASLAFGVTTLHDPSNLSSAIFTQSEMQRAGIVLGPRIYSTGTILYGARTPFTAVVNNLDDALTHLRRQKAEGAISVKSYNQPRRDQRQQLLEAARRTDMMVVPEGGALFQANMSMVVDGHTTVEHALPLAEVWDDVKQLWSQQSTGYTPTLNVGYGGLDGEHYWYARTEVWKHPLLSRYVPRSVLEPRAVRRETAPDEDFNILRVARTATELSRAGVNTMIGAHGQREGLGAHWEMWMFGLGGMTPLEALRTATINPARNFGLDKDLGSLEPGKLADLVVIDGNPLADIRQTDRIVQVMQNGRLFDAATMNQLAPVAKPRKPLFFEGADGRSMPVELQNAHGDD
ncbi:MAG: PD40 domain-containing protein [Proteobacteria bacterium]|jgi:imidazolonepropionase-like amidohydrolase/Tol biopolymer transport system component|nr:amidohydrolase family protein [Burkholderiaceae bacterium]MCH8856180.1 PD40 domain-containing protein [Pseudomonadota bacterium]|mmetsp:Transcript_1092/g.2940  ORF Transcript_1092/g.2940 Transcript_1092/m.2940 type:complete len:1080 (+) Transcript_1092:846-4085(+)